MEFWRPNGKTFLNTLSIPTISTMSITDKAQIIWCLRRYEAVLNPPVTQIAASCHPTNPAFPCGVEK